MTGAEGWTDDVLAGARLARGEDVLDLGAGEATLAFAAHTLVDGGWVIAVDPSVDALEALLARAHELGEPGLMYLVGDADALPLPDGSVDACIGRLPAERAADAAEPAAELRRVLRPGGRVSLLVSSGGEGALAAALEAAGFEAVASAPAADGAGAAVTARRP